MEEFVETSHLIKPLLMLKFHSGNYGVAFSKLQARIRCFFDVRCGAREVISC